MIIILKQQSQQEKVQKLIDSLQEKGLSINYSEGSHTTIIGLVGDTSAIDVENLLAIDIVENIRRVSEPYKLANRKFHNDDSVIAVSGNKVGGGFFGVIAGPCSVESYEQVLAAAEGIKKSGARFLRGGAFKPRTSPYAFRGLRADGIEILLEVKKKVNLPIVSELTSLKYLDLYNDVDVIQVGARNMQNFEMLAELGHCNKTILLKRGLANTLEELLMSAEYILSGGNSQVILCERGIRTFETATRNTLDISAVPLLKQLTHLPVIVDPSHATGIASLVRPLAKAAVVAGADGLMIEVHPSPTSALCDGAQSITPMAFDEIMGDVKNLCSMEQKEL